MKYASSHYELMNKYVQQVFVPVFTKSTMKHEFLRAYSSFHKDRYDYTILKKQWESPFCCWLTKAWENTTYYSRFTYIKIQRHEKLCIDDSFQPIVDSSGEVEFVL